MYDPGVWNDTHLLNHGRYYDLGSERSGKGGFAGAVVFWTAKLLNASTLRTYADSPSLVSGSTKTQQIAKLAITLEQAIHVGLCPSRFRFRCNRYLCHRHAVATWCIRGCWSGNCYVCSFDASVDADCSQKRPFGGEFSASL